MGARTMKNAIMRGAVTLSLAAMFLFSTPAFAKSVKDFEAMPTADQSKYVVDFIEKMTADIGKTNPQLAQQMRDYFANREPGKAFSSGIDRVSIELTALDRVAKEGKADLSKIQIESIIVHVVKEKFPPPAH
jgi:hypothetical protein